MRGLPTGTVTLLFSDIEGSTALLRRLGTQYGDVLSAQRRLMRAAISANGGLEMGTEGDSFYVVFERASNAVECCLEAQRALAAYGWPDGGIVRVRMGLHSGEPDRHQDGYVGMDVHRAARIAAAAHGGQIVLSGATRALVERQLPAGAELSDLGWHRLKDIDSPVRIYQLTAEGLPDHFPPLKSLGAQSSLPVPPAPLVGRDTELAELRLLASRPETRLVTLTGPGGVGKTRLALAVAAALAGQFEQGVYFVGLATVSSAEVMWKTLAGELRADGTGSAEETVNRHLGDRHALVVLDNLEQLDGAADVVISLLAAAPRLMVLATSRRPLHIAGEHEYLIRPLGLAAQADAHEISASGAVQLFAQHAGMVRPGFAVSEANAADVAAICQRLDGLPLAIEIAASRVKLLTPRALLARLGDSLDLSARETGRPSRHQTLRDTIAWSYELLTPDLAEAFRCMAVFAGGCDLDALAAVAIGESLRAQAVDPVALAADLLDMSLITVAEGPDSEPRLGLLETIRQYALERLGSAGELDELRRRHARYYAAAAGGLIDQLRGPGNLTAFDKLESEHDNLRAALTWSFKTTPADATGDSERIATGVQLVQALAPFWYRHSHTAEGRQWLQRAMELGTAHAGAPLAEMAHGLALLMQQQGELREALDLLERSLAIWRDLGDQSWQARELNSLGITRFQMGELSEARALLYDSIAICRETDNDRVLSMALGNLGNVLIEIGDLDEAALALKEALTLDEKLGNVFGLCNDRQALAAAALRAGRASAAQPLLSATFDYVVRSGDALLLANTLELYACVAAGCGQGPRAAFLAGAADAVRRKAGMPRPEPDAAFLERFLAPARAAAQAEEWESELAAGRLVSQQQAALLLAPAGPD
jgi:predicted ATPase/class 3 adenylate cyclase